MWRTPHITDRTRVFLLALAEHMRDDGYVSVPSSELQTMLGKSRQRIQDRVDAAIEADWLVRVSAGHRGHTAVYRACLPGRIATGKLGRITRPENPVAMRPYSDHPGGVTTTRADPPLAASARDDSTDRVNGMDGLRLANPSMASGDPSRVRDLEEPQPETTPTAYARTRPTDRNPSERPAQSTGERA